VVTGGAEVVVVLAGVVVAGAVVPVGRVVCGVCEHDENRRLKAAR